MFITNIYKINFNKFRLIKKINNFNILYNRRNFIIQTPSMKIAALYNIFYNNNYKMYMHLFNMDDKTQLFIKQILKIENTLIELLSLENKKIKRSIIFNKKHKKHFMLLNVQCKNNEPFVNIFDENNNSKDINYIKPMCNTKNIIYLKNIILDNNKISFNWILLQVKIYDYPIDIKKCLIKDNIDTTKSILSLNDSDKLDKKSETSDLNPEYEKYLLMKKRGVPLGAILVDITKNNHDKEYFLNIINEKEEPLKKNYKRPPKKYIEVKNEKKKESFTINPNILKSVKLNKVNKDNKKKKNNKNKNSNSNGSLIPDKKTLKEMISRLKKTKTIKKKKKSIKKNQKFITVINGLNKVKKSLLVKTKYGKGKIINKRNDGYTKIDLNWGILYTKKYKQMY